MKYKDIFLTASSNMFRSKMRTLLTIFAIFIGAFTLTLTSGIGSGISSSVDKEVNNIGQPSDITITAKSTDSTGLGGDAPQKYEPGKLTSSMGAEGPPGSASVILTDKDIDILKANKDLTDVRPNYSVFPDYIQGSNDGQYKITVSTVGANADLDLAAGTKLTPDGSENQLTLPISFVSPLGFSSSEDAVGKTVTMAITDATGMQHTVKATVMSVQQKGLASTGGAVFNNTLRDKLYNLQSTGLPAAAKGKYPSALATIVGDTGDERVSELKSKLDAQDYTGNTVKDQLGTFNSFISAITFVLNGFAVIALLAASFGIVNTLLMSVQERTKEIGLMKAMGMRSNRIFALFSVEAVLIGFWGSILGVGVAILVGTLVNSIVANGILKDLPGFNLVSFPAQSIVFIVLLIMAIAFIAGALPARRAAKQNPIDALRYE